MVAFSGLNQRKLEWKQPLCFCRCRIDVISHIGHFYCSGSILVSVFFNHLRGKDYSAHGDVKPWLIFLMQSFHFMIAI